jgi:hypothetical protein
MRWTGYIACIGTTRNASNILHSKPEGNRSPNLFRLKQENNINRHLKIIEELW